MPTQRKIEANRANAQKSTGPKTRRGKAHAARNARRHGLSVPIPADGVFSAEVKTLANKIAAESSNSEIIELAHRIAEAEMDLVRIRQARHDLLFHNTELNDPNQTTPISEDILMKLVAIDRYERRALSRRKFAIREFDARSLRHSHSSQPVDQLAFEREK